jgi:hypothetical protein
MVKVITFRFFDVSGPYRKMLLDYAADTGHSMHPSLYSELASYAVGLVVMQRLESRHHLVSQRMARGRGTLPATLSAALRRAQNSDHLKPEFRAELSDLLKNIGELAIGLAIAIGPARHHVILRTMPEGRWRLTGGRKVARDWRCGVGL